jgi:hypothetical protein
MQVRLRCQAFGADHDVGVFILKLMLAGGRRTVNLHASWSIERVASVEQAWCMTHAYAGNVAHVADAASVDGRLVAFPSQRLTDEQGERV